MKRKISKLLAIMLTAALVLAIVPLGSISVSAGSNPYSQYAKDDQGRWANCTYWCWRIASEYGFELPSYSWGNARSWYDSAMAAGYQCDQNPSADSIVVKNTGTYGHVQYVEEVSGDRLYVKEGGYWESADGYHEGWTSMNNVIGYIHLTPQGNNPFGNVDTVESKSAGTIHITGWAFDWDNTNTALDIHIYVGGPAGSGASCYVIKANKERADINKAYPGAGNYHGFDETIAVSKSGTQDVYAYAINIGSGNSNPNLTSFPKNVNIIADTEPPKIDVKYLSLVTEDSFRVCVVPTDNAGIQKVRIATWTQEDQSDVIWHDAHFNGTETYFIDIDRKDYSDKNNSFYHNHIYVYDYSGNYAVAGLGMDYEKTNDNPVVPGELNETDPQAVIESKSAKPGDTVTVAVTLKNTPNIKSMSASNVTYDTSALTLTGAKWKASDALLSSWDSDKGNGVVSFGETGDRNGKVLELTFKVKDSAPEANYTVGITYRINSGDENETIATVPGTIRVKNFTPGDLNGDDKVTDDDAIYLLFHTFFPDEYPVSQNCDFNGDGKTNDNDAIYLLFYTFFPEDYPI